MNRLNLRKRKHINYYEPDEPPLDEYIYCEHCYDFVYEYCCIHGPLLIIPDNKVTSLDGIPLWVPRAALTTPREFVHIAPSGIPGAGLGVFSTLTLPRGVRFGPYQGKLTDDVTSSYCWQIHKKTKRIVVDGQDKETSNWMRYVNCARSWREQNLVAFQYKGQIYYRTVKIVPKFTELLVFYGSEFAHTLRIDLKNYNKPQGFQIGKYIVEDFNPNQKETNKEDYFYKTETLAICDAELESNKKNIETHAEILERATYFTTPRIEIGIDTINSSDFSNITVANDIATSDNDVELINNKAATIKTDKLECDICHKTYKTKDSLRSHIYVHYNAQYSCIQCTYKTSVKRHFNDHINRHRKDKVFPCVLCTYVGHMKTDLQRHMKRIHSDKILEQATFPSKTQRGFRIDTTTQYSDSSNIIAENYTVTHDITTANNYIVAANNIENNDIVVASYIENKDFGAENYIEKNYKANDKATNDENKHTTIKKETLACDICHKTFSNNYSLKRHKNIHGEAKDAKYICMQCPYKTHMRYYFQRHMDIHRKDKEFPCELCDYVGNLRLYLQRHMKRIHGDKILKQSLYFSKTEIGLDIDRAQSSNSSNIITKNNTVTDGNVAANYVKNYDIVAANYVENNDKANDIATNNYNKDPTMKRERLQCDICYKTCSNNYNLKRHKYVHGESKVAQ